MNKFISSRNKNDSLSSHEAIIRGLAKDGGLYTPESITNKIDISKLIGKTYQEISEEIISVIFDDFSKEEIHECVYGAYDSKFDNSEIVPITKISDGYLMELWHGPTSAFKDLALTILPRLLTTAYKKENRNDTVAILTATSGDTGKAALSGFADVPHTAITVFYPEIGVSAIQKKQMQTSKGSNVDVIAVKGNFDDCQRMVKEACSSKEVLAVCDNVVISSANSINIGRLVPQIVYYFSSYANLVKNNEINLYDKVNFVVPTGNFGDILAGYLAKLLGLPINKLICASNSNNVLTDFLNTGRYSIDREFHATMSPSMDILISSNLERLLFMISDNDDELVSNLMNQLKENGYYELSENLLSKIKSTFAGYWADENTCINTIHSLFQNEHIIIDPHTSIALSVMRSYKEKTHDSTPCIVLSTASPYKFCKDVLKSISNQEIEDDFEAMDILHKLSNMDIPKGLEELKDLDIRFNRSINKEDGIKVIAKRIEEISHVKN